MDISRIRNFCIIAHIDHGKSTLADRLLEKTGTVEKREMKAQMLDDMVLERERGITIKARAVALRHQHQGKEYELNLIDTPGHVDFQYEVSRSLTCCEGALLLVDAFQGVEAQTVANAYAAMSHDLKIIPVINKIDLQHARVAEVMEEMSQSLGIDPDEIVLCSGKTGIGVDDLLKAIVDRIPAPTGDPQAQLQAMVFDSHYDDYRGAITYARIMAGTVVRGQKIRLARANAVYETVELGQFVPHRRPVDKLIAGQVGYLICNIKSLKDFTDKDRIALPSIKVSSQAIYLQIAAEKAFGPGKHAQLDHLVVALSHPDAVAAVMNPSSEIASHFATSPFHELEKKAGFNTITSSYEIMGGESSILTFISTEKFRTANPTVYAIVVAAFEEAMDYSNADLRRLVKLYAEVANDKKNSEDELHAIVTQPGFKFSRAPATVGAMTDFMHKIGLIKNKPASWKDLFFAEAHSLPGN